ncbi:MAG TPA: hypothetical protein VGX16_05080 [Solirubrobacteraceae bacterium]|jgi:hypothetical protein|nr:hypothetical protein [Solirubrobacteraceae bacterium]
MAGQARQVSVGFEGGQVLAVKVSEEQLEGLYRMLGSTGWHALDTEDGPVRLDLARVVYVRAENGDQRVGFGV